MGIDCLKKILICGAGRMGKVVEEEALRQGVKYRFLSEDMLCGRDGSEKKIIDERFDGIIDFSHPSLTKKLADFAVKLTLPLVVCTTGQSEEDVNVLEQAALKIPVALISNAAEGMNFAYKIIEQTAARFAMADAEIFEVHHSGKADSPSGTAKEIALIIKNARKNGEIRYARTGKRKTGEIGICSQRMGKFIGKHSASFYLGDEEITVIHEAFSRSAFAKGAFVALTRLLNLPAGRLYGKEVYDEVY